MHGDISRQNLNDLRSQNCVEWCTSVGGGGGAGERRQSERISRFEYADLFWLCSIWCLCKATHLGLLNIFDAYQIANGIAIEFDRWLALGIRYIIIVQLYLRLFCSRAFLAIPKLSRA